MKRVFAVLLMICLALTLTACQQNDGSFSVKRKDKEVLELRLMDVWQDDNQHVMVTLEGTGKGKLLRGAVKWEGDQIVGRMAMPEVTVQILVGDEWISSNDYPDGMFETDGNGSLTVRFAATTMPTQVDVSSVKLELSKLTLPGVDRKALLAAEAAAIETANEKARQLEEAAAQRIADAQVILPKQELDTEWIDGESLSNGESIYYACTGLEKADAVGISFILSADGASARNIQAIVLNADGGSTFYGQMKQALKMSYPIENCRLNVSGNGILLDVTLSEGRAEGVFEFSIESSADAIGRKSYISCGVAKVEMDKAR